VEVVERDERDMEEVGPAPGVVTRQRGYRRLHLRRRLGHDVEGVPGAHGRECSMGWGIGRFVRIIWNQSTATIVQMRRSAV